MLVAVLTGIVNSPYLLYLNNIKKDKQIKILETEKENFCSRLLNDVSEDEKIWLDREIQKIDNQINELKNK